MYLCFLDAMIAFDRVNHWTLLKKKVNGAAPVHLEEIQKYWEQQQQCAIRWRSSTSNPFQTSNRIRQGGLHSPLQFNVYVDSLLVRVALCRIGCHIGNCCVNEISYTDDTVLPNRQVDALQNIPNICEIEVETLDIEYNTSKSV